MKRSSITISTIRRLKILLLVGALWAVVQGEDDVHKLRLAPPERTYKVLFILLGTLRSHEMMITPVIDALADRGHQVTVLGGNRKQTHENITNYHFDFSFEEYLQQPFFAFITQPYLSLKNGQSLVYKLAKQSFDSPVVNELYARKEEFDMIIIDHLVFLGLYPFVHGKIFALYSASTYCPVLSAAFGNIQSPAYQSSAVEDFPRPYSTFYRLKNLVYTGMRSYIWNRLLRSRSEEEVSKRFPLMPSSLELQNNASIVFTNTDFAADDVTPLLPNQVLVGGMLNRPGRPLPSELNSFLAGNDDAIYMTFGSLIPSSKIPAHIRQLLFSVFKKLSYKIIFKFDNATKEEQAYKNIFLGNWFPQQDVLAHPKVKLFVTHCGVNGVHEAIYHSVPVICLPVQGDHLKMASYVHETKIGICLNWVDVSEEQLYTSILEIFRDPGYRRRVEEKSRIFRDHPNTPLERAVFWTEYALRHGGAKHLQSPGKDVSWIEILYLDVLVYAFLFFYVMFRVFIPRMYALLSSKFSQKPSDSERSQVSPQKKKRR